jgi:ABC-type transport system substrate-binding protein
VVAPRSLRVHGSPYATRTRSKLFSLACFLVCSLILVGASLTPTSSALPSQFGFQIFDYHGPYVNEVTFSVYRGADAQWSALADDLVDVANEPVNPQERLAIQTSRSEYSSFWGLALNTFFDKYFVGEPEGPQGRGGWPTNYLALRQAIAMAIDKYALAAMAFGAEGLPVENVVPSYLTAWYNPGLPVDYRAGDLAGASAVLDAAVFLDANHDGYREAPDARTFRLSLLYVPLLQAPKALWHSLIATNTTRIAEYIGDVLGSLHLNCGIYPFSQTSFDYFTHYGRRDYNLALMPFTVPGRTPFYLEDLFYSYSIPTTNIFNFSNATVDALLESVNTTLSYDTLHDNVLKLQTDIAQNLPLIPLITRYSYAAHRTDRFEEWVEVPGVGAANIWSLLSSRLKPDQVDRNPASGVGGALRVALGEAPADLNPLTVSVDDTWLVLNSMYSRLVEEQPFTGKPIPSLATNWIIEPEGNGLRVTFNLVNNATWHDGVRFTAYDVNFTYNYVNNLPGPWPYPGPKPFINVASIEVLNNVTLVMHTPLNGYFALFDIASQLILPKHIWEGIIRPAFFRNPRPVGTGPFRFVSQPEPGVINLEYYPDYHYGVPGPRELPPFVDVYLLSWLAGGLFVVTMVAVGAVWYLRRTPHGMRPD